MKSYLATSSGASFDKKAITPCNAWERDAGLRLDHFLLGPHLVPRLKKAGVDKAVRGWKRSSDHAPAWIILK